LTDVVTAVHGEYLLEMYDVRKIPTTLEIKQLSILFWYFGGTVDSSARMETSMPAIPFHFNFIQESEICISNIARSRLQIIG
jgi:hypothetical protein